MYDCDPQASEGTKLRERKTGIFVQNMGPEGFEPTTTRL